MSPLIAVNQIKMRAGSKLLFEDLSFGLFENEKVGLIGPNGSGKSTLLKIIVGLETPDQGEVSTRKNLKIAFLNQNSKLNESLTVQKHIIDHLVKKWNVDPFEAEVQASIQLSITGFENTNQTIEELSGGWRKRLEIATCLAEDPDFLILDEPTNHMDWDGILWLENWLKNYKKPLMIVSHDRIFLNSITNRTIEINNLYTNGYLSFNCKYQDFLIKKEEYIQAQLNLEKILSNKARREVEWLRAGVKARTTKSSSRIKEAYELLDNLEIVKQKNYSGSSVSRITIDGTQRKTKKLIDIKNLSVGFKTETLTKYLVKNLNLTFGPKSCIGILGQNGSGKTSFLRTIQNPELALSGQIIKVDDLKTVYFDQKRESLPSTKNLMEYLGDGADHVVFKNKSIHVASYASRFLFTSDKMNLKIEQLSGGEQARLLIAKLFLNPADILILDEPTNDLDIDTIEVLEDILKDFEGLLLLVSHDRKFLENLCQKYLSLDGNGSWATYADLEQWLKQKSKSIDKIQSDTADKNKDQKEIKALNEIEEPEKTHSKIKLKLSYKDKKALETIEADIEMAEKNLVIVTKNLEDFRDFNNKELLNTKIAEVTAAQKEVERLYAYWDELELKRSQN